MVQEGETVELVCNVTGTPRPDVTWFRIPTGLMQKEEVERRQKQIGVSGEVLVIHNVTRYCDDVYECVAFNNVPPAAHRSIRVHVEFPPEVRLPNRKIGQSKGKTTILECVVTAYPHAITVWKRNGEDIDRNSKYNIEVYDEDENTLTLALRIQSLTQEDYGQYECVSQNLLGKDSETMMLYEYPVMERTTTSTTTTTKRTTPRQGHGQTAHGTEGRHNGGNPYYRPQHNSNLAGSDTGGNWGDSNAAAQGYKDNYNNNNNNDHNNGNNNNNGYGGQGGDGTIRDPSYHVNGGENGAPRNEQVMEAGSRATTLTSNGFLLLPCVSVLASLTLLR